MRMRIPMDACKPMSATASNAAYLNTAARAGAAYAADGLNRLTGTTGTTLIYDALDQLNQVVSGAGTKFLYEGQQIIAEYNGSGALQRRYIPSPRLDNPYLWFEGTGTVGSTGAANTTLGINQYDEFGVEPTTNLGRFMQPDPCGYSDGMNLYAFVHNGPINGRDVLGLLEYLDEVTVTAHRTHRPTIDISDFDLTVQLDYSTPELAGGGREGTGIEGDEPQAEKAKACGKANMDALDLGLMALSVVQPEVGLVLVVGKTAFDATGMLHESSGCP